LGTLESSHGHARNGGSDADGIHGNENSVFQSEQRDGSCQRVGDRAIKCYERGIGRLQLQLWDVSQSLRPE
jgi:hypothetical protein